MSPNGRFLLYFDPEYRLMVLNVETRDSGPLIPAATAPSGVSFRGAARWSPDGTFILLEGYMNAHKWPAYEGVTYDTVTR